LQETQALHWTSNSFNTEVTEKHGVTVSVRN
jgi:hypothetical protein